MDYGNAHQKLTREDALAFLMQVKVVFKDKREKYNEFLEIMKDYRAERDTKVMRARVTELFKGHNDLILGFNNFLPNGYKIPLSLDDEKLPTIENALAFVMEVKVVFKDKREKYDQFLKLLNDYHAQRIDIKVTRARVMELFKEQKDLIWRFNNFLPNGYQIPDDEQQDPLIESMIQRFNQIIGLSD